MMEKPESLPAAPQKPATSTSPADATQWRALVVDDSELNRTLLRGLLNQENIQARYSSDAQNALKRLEEEDFDLVILDVHLPDMDGFELCRRIRSSSVFGHLPVLMVSGVFTEEQSVVKGLTAGANDFVRAPFAPIEFLARARGLLRLKSAEDRLRAMALEDPLTHLGNRAYFFQRAEEELARARRYGNVLSLALFDIDHFKQINDTWGHQAGDMVLTGIAALVRETVRREDVASRWGGDEFAILFVETPLAGAWTVMERFLNSMREADFSLEGKGLRATASIGLAEYHHLRHKTIDDLVYTVDTALYEVKRNGGGHIRQAAANGESTDRGQRTEQGAR